MKIQFNFKFDHIIDLITNSSSELFVLENKCAKSMIVELVNSALEGHFTISEDSVEERFYRDGSIYDGEYKIERALEAIPEQFREEAKEKYFSKPLYYGISFDRDEIYLLYRDKNFDVRQKLANIGFELEDTDY